MVQEVQQEVNDRLIGKLQELSDRFDLLNDQLAEPEVASNPAKTITITKELGRMRRLVEPYRKFSKVRTDLEQTKAILDDRSQDRDLRELAESEVDGLQARHDAMLEELKSAMVSDDDAAITSIMLEIRAGTGGDEAALFVRDLYEMYLRFCEKKRLSVEVLDQSGSELGGLKDVTLNIK